MQKSVLIIGKGNAGTHLAALFGKSFRVTHISARAIIEHKNIHAEPSIFDLVILAVPDNMISKTAEALPTIKAPLCHTAGSASLKLIQPFAENVGVIYPFQTLRKEYSLYTEQIPLIIEGNNPTTLQIIKDFCLPLSGQVYELDSEQRKWLHLSGVFACNFVNHLYTLASDLIISKGLNYELLHPLIMETALRAIKNGAAVSQTGPAMRKDTETIESHLQLLRYNKDLQKIYKLLTESINIKHIDDELQEKPS